jgi:hypothetical protein
VKSVWPEYTNRGVRALTTAGRIHEGQQSGRTGEIWNDARAFRGGGTDYDHTDDCENCLERTLTVSVSWLTTRSHNPDAWMPTKLMSVPGSVTFSPLLLPLTIVPAIAGVVLLLKLPAILRQMELP